MLISHSCHALQLTKYQEQPQLLDASLEAIVQPLAVLLRKTAESSTAHDTALVQGVCRMLHVLISVRGYKTVVRFFPHEAADLERVLQVRCSCCRSHNKRRLEDLLLVAAAPAETACSSLLHRAQLEMAELTCQCTAMLNSVALIHCRVQLCRCLVM